MTCKDIMIAHNIRGEYSNLLRSIHCWSGLLQQNLRFLTDNFGVSKEFLLKFVRVYTVIRGFIITDVISF